MSTIAQRKNEHLDAVLAGGDARMRTGTGLESVRFAHVACPELDLDAIDLSTTLLGKQLRAPFLISSMTGGPARAADINTHLAIAAQELGIAFAVGSQRVALEMAGAGGLDAGLRAHAPDIPLLANLGAAQLRGADGADRARRAVEM
ncbi:MAG: alpha-hydroxy-acid oxidizing protein, partial [Pseudomonadota bacterium]